MNEAVSVKADDQMLYFEALGMQSYGAKRKSSPFRVRGILLGLFIQPLQP